MTNKKFLKCLNELGYLPSRVTDTKASFHVLKKYKKHIEDIKKVCREYDVNYEFIEKDVNYKVELWVK